MSDDEWMLSADDLREQGSRRIELAGILERLYDISDSWFFNEETGKFTHNREHDGVVLWVTVQEYTHEASWGIEMATPSGYAEQLGTSSVKGSSHADAAEKALDEALAFSEKSAQKLQALRYK